MQTLNNCIIHHLCQYLDLKSMASWSLVNKFYRKKILQTPKYKNVLYLLDHCNVLSKQIAKYISTKSRQKTKVLGPDHGLSAWFEAISIAVSFPMSIKLFGKRRKVGNNNMFISSLMSESYIEITEIVSSGLMFDESFFALLVCIVYDNRKGFELIWQKYGKDFGDEIVGPLLTEIFLFDRLEIFLTVIETNPSLFGLNILDNIGPLFSTTAGCRNPKTLKYIASLPGHNLDTQYIFVKSYLNNDINSIQCLVDQCQIDVRMHEDAAFLYVCYKGYSALAYYLATLCDNYYVKLVNEPQDDKSYTRVNKNLYLEYNIE